MVKKKKKAKKKIKKKNRDAEGASKTDGHSDSLDLASNDRRDSHPIDLQIDQIKKRNIYIDVSGVSRVPVDICFCPSKKEKTDDIELLLRTIEGISQEIPSKPIYPLNSVWAKWSTH